MVDKVINLADYQPHLTGKAICVQCKHEWQAVAPLGTLYLTCPECGLDKGCFNSICCPEVYYECVCGCAHFFVSKTGHAICALCGTPKPL